MSDVPVCPGCGADERRPVVQHGSYILMRPRCSTGLATSWLAIGVRMGVLLRACVVDEDWRELEVVAEGEGAAFAQAVGAVASTGKRVELRPLAPS